MRQYSNGFEGSFRDERMRTMGFYGDSSTLSDYRGVTFTGLAAEKRNGTGVPQAGAARYAAARKNRYRIKKRLNYNANEISSQILRASKAQSASVALVRAKSKVGVLKRCIGTGQYDDNEVRPALLHAQRMVLVANKKVRNLREEERERSSYKKKKLQKNLERKRELKAAVEDKKERILNEKLMEQMQEIQREKRQRLEMERKSRLHRNNERGKIAEANMKYLKDQIGQDYDSQYRVDISGVVCSISASAASLVGLENAAMFLDGEGEILLESSLDMSGMDADMACAGIADAGGCIDISL